MIYISKQNICFYHLGTLFKNKMIITMSLLTLLMIMNLILDLQFTMVMFTML